MLIYVLTYNFFSEIFKQLQRKPCFLLSLNNFANSIARQNIKFCLKINNLSISMSNLIFKIDCKTNDTLITLIYT